MKRMIAYCGLDCQKCDAYLATLHNDDALREKTAAEWSKLNQITITPKDINCQGCRADGAKTVYCEHLCEIRKCAMQKGFETCGNCGELESCPKLHPIVSTNADALKNLKED